jgi:hypothetical protein
LLLKLTFELKYNALKNVICTTQLKIGTKNHFKMRSYKYIVLSAVLTLGVFFAVLYTSSCSKDACKGITCLHGSNCGGGACICKNGTGGSNCETIYRDLYTNTYKGNGTDDSGGNYINNTFTFTTQNDTNYVKMELIWTNPATRIVTMPIILSNNTVTGSSFTITQTTVDSFTYTGIGNVSGTTATLTLTEAHPNSTPVHITLTNFTRQ